MEKSYNTARDFCVQRNKDKFANYMRFFPPKTREKLSTMVDADGKTLIRHALQSRALNIVEYMLESKFIGEHIDDILDDCAAQEDCEALTVFMRQRPNVFTQDMKARLIDQSGGSFAVINTFNVYDCKFGHTQRDMRHSRNDHTNSTSQSGMDDSMSTASMYSAHDYDAETYHKDSQSTHVNAGGVDIEVSHTFRKHDAARQNNPTLLGISLGGQRQSNTSARASNSPVLPVHAESSNVDGWTSTRTETDDSREHPSFTKASAVHDGQWDRDPMPHKYTASNMASVATSYQGDSAFGPVNHVLPTGSKYDQYRHVTTDIHMPNPVEPDTTVTCTAKSVASECETETYPIDSSTHSKTSLNVSPTHHTETLPAAASLCSDKVSHTTASDQNSSIKRTDMCSSVVSSDITTESLKAIADTRSNTALQGKGKYSTVVTSTAAVRGDKDQEETRSKRVKDRIKSFEGLTDTAATSNTPNSAKPTGDTRREAPQGKCNDQASNSISNVSSKGVKFVKVKTKSTKKLEKSDVNENAEADKTKPQQTRKVSFSEIEENPENVSTGSIKSESTPEDSLTVAERKLTSVYFKMAKLGIPSTHIHQKMSLDGLPLSLCEKVMIAMGTTGTETQPGTPEKIGKDVRRSATLTSRKKLLRLHWKPLNASSLSASSLWSASALDEESISPDVDEIDEIEKIFGAVPHKTLTSKSKVKFGTCNSAHMPKVLDPQRSTNISIGIANFRKVGSMRCILNGVCSLNDMRRQLTVDRLLNLSAMMPSIAEAKALQSVDTLNKAEMFCKLAMEYYPHLAGRLSCFLTLSQFEETQASVLPKMQLFVNALDNIMQSKRLALILNKILVIGNTLNEGTAMGSAAGFTIGSLAHAMTLRGGSDKKVSVLDFVVKTLRRKGHDDILQVVKDIELVDDVCKLSVLAITSEASEADREYEDLKCQLKIAEDYLLFYYQAALESWQQATTLGSKYVVKEEDIVDTPFGPGTVKEIRPNDILKVRPSKWHLVGEVAHSMFLHKDEVSVRSPFVVGDIVETHHGPGTVVEIRQQDSIAVIQPLTWNKSSVNTPVVYEPIVGLRPLYDQSDYAVMPSSDSDMPKLTRRFINTLRAFINSSSEKIVEMKRLKEKVECKVQEISAYFGEHNDDGVNINEMLEVLRAFRYALLPLYEAQEKEKAKIEAHKASSASATQSDYVNGSRHTRCAPSKMNWKHRIVENKKYRNPYCLRTGMRILEMTRPMVRIERRVPRLVIAKYRKKLRSVTTILETPVAHTSDSVVSKSALQAWADEEVTAMKSVKPLFVTVAEDSSDSSSDETSSSSDIDEFDHFDDYEKWLNQYYDDLKAEAATRGRTASGSLMFPAAVDVTPSEVKRCFNPSTALMSGEGWSAHASKVLGFVDRLNFIHTKKIDQKKSSALTQSNVPEKFKDFSFADNIEELVTRREKFGPQALTSYELEALDYFYSNNLVGSRDVPDDSSEPLILQGADMMLQSHVHGYSTPRRNSYSSDTEMPLSPEKFSGFSFEGNISELVSRRDRYGEDSLTSVELEALQYYEDNTDAKSKTALTERVDTFDVPVLDVNLQKECSDQFSALRSLLQNDTTERADSSSPQYIVVDDSDALSNRFKGFSFSDNLMELVRRRDLCGEESLTSVELEALEYYADVIENCVVRADNAPDAMDENTTVIPSTDANAIRSATDSVHTLLEHVKQRSSYLQSVDVDDNLDPDTDYLLEVIRARVNAEKLMASTRHLLESESDDDVKDEAERIMIRIEREREIEVRELLERLDRELAESADIPREDSEDSCADAMSTCLDADNTANSEVEGKSSVSTPNDHQEEKLSIAQSSAADARAIVCSEEGITIPNEVESDHSGSVSVDADVGAANEDEIVGAEVVPIDDECTSTPSRDDGDSNTDSITPADESTASNFEHISESPVANASSEEGITIPNEVAPDHSGSVSVDADVGAANEDEAVAAEVVPIDDECTSTPSRDDGDSNTDSITPADESTASNFEHISESPVANASSEEGITIPNEVASDHSGSVSVDADVGAANEDEIVGAEEVPIDDECTSTPSRDDGDSNTDSITPADESTASNFEHIPESPVANASSEEGITIPNEVASDHSGSVSVDADVGATNEDEAVAAEVVPIDDECTSTPSRDDGDSNTDSITPADESTASNFEHISESPVANASSEEGITIPNEVASDHSGSVSVDADVGAANEDEIVGAEEVPIDDECTSTPSRDDGDSNTDSITPADESTASNFEHIPESPVANASSEEGITIPNEVASDHSGSVSVDADVGATNEDEAVAAEVVPIDDECTSTPSRDDGDSNTDSITPADESTASNFEHISESPVANASSEEGITIPNEVASDHSGSVSVDADVGATNEDEAVAAEVVPIDDECTSTPSRDDGDSNTDSITPADESTASNFEHISESPVANASSEEGITIPNEVAPDHSGSVSVDADVGAANEDEIVGAEVVPIEDECTSTPSRDDGDSNTDSITPADESTASNFEHISESPVANASSEEGITIPNEVAPDHSGSVSVDADVGATNEDEIVGAEVVPIDDECTSTPSRVDGDSNTDSITPADESTASNFEHISESPVANASSEGGITIPNEVASDHSGSVSVDADVGAANEDEIVGAEVVPIDDECTSTPSRDDGDSSNTDSITPADESTASNFEHISESPVANASSEEEY